MKGSDVKDLAIAASVLVGLYLAYRFYQNVIAGGKAVVDSVEKTYDYFANNNPAESFGADAYGYFHSGETADSIAKIDEPTAIRACNLQWARNGHVSGAICETLYTQGKLTPPANASVQ